LLPRDRDKDLVVGERRPDEDDARDVRERRLREAADEERVGVGGRRALARGRDERSLDDRGELAEPSVVAAPAGLRDPVEEARRDVEPPGAGVREREAEGDARVV